MGYSSWDHKELDMTEHEDTLPSHYSDKQEHSGARFSRPWRREEGADQFPVSQEAREPPEAPATLGLRQSLEVSSPDLGSGCL